MSYKKHKTPAKVVLARGNRLNETVLETMAQISSIVGSTLGPGGQQVLLERDEAGLPPFVTKDGVTVYRALGYHDPVAHAVLEVARDASVRTASEAGDGTTTATVLSEALVRYTQSYLADQDRIAPQSLVRGLARQLPALIEAIEGLASSVSSETDEGRELMRKIAVTSANGDEELAAAVLESFEVSGDEGNVTLIEASGPSGYAVEAVSGFPLGVGYEDSCGRFASKFVNDHVNQRIVLDNPTFLLYNGKVTDFAELLPILQQIATKYTTMAFNHNVVICATGFSDAVLGQLAFIFSGENNIRPLPCVVPMSPVINGTQEWLEDLAAITGATVLSPLAKALDAADIEDLGPVTDFEDSEGKPQCKVYGAKHFEMGRFRSLVLGVSETPEIAEARLARSEALGARRAQEGVSQLDQVLLSERIAKLTGSIARLKVYGSSNGECKEKRDRAEDAICAVRGALKHGALPGGGWTLVYLAQLLRSQLPEESPVVQILARSCEEPVIRLLTNAGFDAETIGQALGALRENVDVFLADPETPMTAAEIVDLQTCEVTSAMDRGVVDSLPAVREALRNAVSIATLLGTLGGAVVHPRDAEFERREAEATADFNRHANGPAFADTRA